MLNISNTSVAKHITPKKYSSLVNVESKKSSKVFRRIIYISLGLLFIILFLPWTQNIRTSGLVTTLEPNQRPQNIHSIIGGRIENWFVREGDYVEKGDTILKISEIKDAYFDDKLLERTQNQVQLKKQSLTVYDDKIKAQDEQLRVLVEQRDLQLQQTKIKLEQTRLKVQNDSAAYAAALSNRAIAEYQYQRADSLYEQGLKSLTDLEKRNLKYQETSAYAIEAKNKWLNSQNDLINLQLELANVKMKFETDYNKLLSGKFTTLSNQLDTETNINKLENEYSNYEFRSKLYYITAPQDGYVTKMISTGIGETIKEGQNVLTLSPAHNDLVVEIYVEPIDLPLVNVDQEVQIQFDGWPAIVFSGWPNASRGTYNGKIYAIDRYISDNGKYRLLVKPDPESEEWPDALRFGSGTMAMILLNDVPIWYELWRRINGFPPDFYTMQKPSKDPQKK